MNGDEVLDVLGRLDAAGVAWWIDGGWGVDALLGEETRPHDDLDLIVRREDLDRVRALLPEFVRVEDDWWPARYVLRDASGRQIDFHPVTFDEQGDGLAGTPRRHLRSLPGGRPTRYRQDRRPRRALHHAGASACAPRLFDRRAGRHRLDDVRVLCERFGLAVPPAYAERPGFVEAKRRQASPRI